MRTEVERLKAVVAGEGTFESLLALGRALYALSRFEEAEQCLAEARRLEPSRGDVHLLLGRCLAQLNRLDEADDEYRKAARLLPRGDGVLLEWSHVLQERGKGMRSRRVADEARRLAEELSASGKPTDSR
jgi:cytochrome c-type biogenesis protein CcmH/NrfG